jgi:hypothetical protein
MHSGGAHWRKDPYTVTYLLSPSNGELRRVIATMQIRHCSGLFNRPIRPIRPILYVSCKRKGGVRGVEEARREGRPLLGKVSFNREPLTFPLLVRRDYLFLPL